MILFNTLYTRDFKNSRNRLTNKFLPQIAHFIFNNVVLFPKVHFHRETILVFSRTQPHQAQVYGVEILTCAAPNVAPFAFKVASRSPVICYVCSERST